MTSPSPEEFKQVYLRNLPSRIETLESRIRDVETGKPDALKMARALAHSLAGSGGTYGFPQVSASAKEAEKCPDDSFLEKARDLLDILKKISSEPQRKFNLMIVEDEPDISSILETLLQTSRRSVVVCSNAQEAEDALQANPIDFIITDLTLPDLDGRLLIKKVRQVREMAKVPIYVLTGMDFPKIREECLSLGANGFFSKPFDPIQLVAQVEEKIKESSMSLPQPGLDLLTQLPDRHALKMIFDKAVADPSENRRPLSMVLFNLDMFSKINEKHGRSIGDQILAYVGTALSKLTGGKGTAARTGGDTFAVLLERHDSEAAQSFAERTVKEIGEISFEIGDQAAVKMGLSGGLVQVPIRADFEEALSACERLLYRAKGAGRGRVFSEKSSLASSAARKVIVADDDDLIRSLVNHRLSNEGFEVLGFPDGRKTLEAAQKNNASLFILDVQMPGMDGFELLTKLRALPSANRTPIMMLTSLGSEKDISRGFELGANDYLAKPFSPAELVARSLRLLKG